MCQRVCLLKINHWHFCYDVWTYVNQGQAKHSFFVSSCMTIFQLLITRKGQSLQVTHLIRTCLLAKSHFLFARKKKLVYTCRKIQSYYKKNTHHYCTYLMVLIQCYLLARPCIQQQDFKSNKIHSFIGN